MRPCLSLNNRVLTLVTVFVWSRGMLHCIGITLHTESPQVIFCGQRHIEQGLLRHPEIVELLVRRVEARQERRVRADHEPSRWRSEVEVHAAETRGAVQTTQGRARVEHARDAAGRRGRRAWRRRRVTCLG